MLYQKRREICITVATRSMQRGTFPVILRVNIGPAPQQDGAGGTAGQGRSLIFFNIWLYQLSRVHLSHINDSKELRAPC